jgi:hypothetical protein
MASTGGSTTYMRDLTDLLWSLSPSPLHAYLAAARSDHSWPLTSELAKTFFADSDDQAPERSDDRAPSAQPATLRAWLELLLTLVSEPRRDRASRTDGPDPGFAISDDVLRALRLNAIWSAVLSSDRLAVAPELMQAAGTSDVGSHYREVQQVPAGILGILRKFAERDGALIPVLPDYPSGSDDGGGRGHMTWCLRRERILLTAYSRSRDRYPGFSSLNLFGWFGHMVLSITSAKQTIHLIAEEVARRTTRRNPDMVNVAHSFHSSFLELEELYDLDIAWPTYQMFYQRLRDIIGLESEYQRVRDRIELLTHFSEVELRVSGERMARAFAIIGVLFAIGVVFASLGTLIVTTEMEKKVPIARWLVPTLWSLGGAAVLAWVIYLLMRRKPTAGLSTLDWIRKQVRAAARYVKLVR